MFGKNYIDDFYYIIIHYFLQKSIDFQGPIRLFQHFIGSLIKHFRVC